MRLVVACTATSHSVSGRTPDISLFRTCDSPPAHLPVAAYMKFGELPPSLKQ